VYIVKVSGFPLKGQRKSGSWGWGRWENSKKGRKGRIKTSLMSKFLFFSSSLLKAVCSDHSTEWIVLNQENILTICKI
jgi:hypothetical protein